MDEESRSMSEHSSDEPSDTHIFSDMQNQSDDSTDELEREREKLREAAREEMKARAEEMLEDAKKDDEDLQKEVGELEEDIAETRERLSVYLSELDHRRHRAMKTVKRGGVLVLGLAALTIAAIVVFRRPQREQQDEA